MPMRSHLAACLFALLWTALWTVLWTESTWAYRRLPRSRAPQAWDPETERLLKSNPLELLKGERPVAGGKGTSTGQDGPGSGTPDNGGSPAGFAWSNLISAAAIADEIKAHHQAGAENVRSPAVFTSGGNRKLRQQFSVIAVMFGIAAEYDGEVRWKQTAAAARDGFGKAARNAKAADQNTFREAKARSDDLDELVRGGSVEFGEAQDQVLWSDVSQREPLMRRFDQAHNDRLRPWTATESEFNRHLAEIRHEAEILAALAEVIKHEAFEFHDDDMYVGYCSQLQRHAATISQGAKDKNLSEVQRAVGDVTKTCDACHEGYK